MYIPSVFVFPEEQKASVKTAEDDAGTRRGSQKPVREFENTLYDDLNRCVCAPIVDILRQAKKTHRSMCVIYRSNFLLDVS